MKTRTTILIAVLCLFMNGCGDDVTAPDPLADVHDPTTLLAEPTTAGNNLSFPVIWGDGVGKVLRGTYGTELFAGECTNVGTELEPVWAYHQQDPLNEWQAQSVDGTAAPIDVSWIDWGDNLEARPWNVGSPIRVEVVLVQDLVEPLLGYEMAYVSGQGIDEMWGATTATYPSTQATVYSHCARMVIQKVLPPADPNTEPVLTWNATSGEWEGDVSVPTFKSGVWNSGDGPSGFSAEINVKGKVIYGYNWRVTNNQGEGTYRLTFSLVSGLSIPLNTLFETSQILIPVEEVLKGDDSGSEPAGGVAVIDHANDITYMDVVILPRKGGGKGGTRDSGDGGGGGGGGGHGGGGGGH